MGRIDSARGKANMCISFTSALEKKHDDTYLLSYSHESQQSEVSLAGLNSRCPQGELFLETGGGLGFPAFGGSQGPPAQGISSLYLSHLQSTSPQPPALSSTSSF